MVSHTVLARRFLRLLATSYSSVSVACCSSFRGDLPRGSNDVALGWLTILVSELCSVVWSSGYAIRIAARVGHDLSDAV